MRISNFIRQMLCASLLVFASATINHRTSAQTATTTVAPPAQTAAPVERQQRHRPIVNLPPAKAARAVAGRTDLYCAGFVQYVPIQNRSQIVGGEQEQEQNVYKAGDYVYISNGGGGTGQPLRVGQEFLVIRPRGQFTSDFTKKKGYLGVYVQEVGTVRVVDIRERVSVALVTNSCETLLLGDLLQDINNRVAPVARPETALDRFSAPSGKATGRIVLARDGREMVSRGEVVFIDLGVEDNLKAGDYLTVYRPVGKGNITHLGRDETGASARNGYESNVYKGGKFSNKAPRVNDVGVDRERHSGLYMGAKTNTPEIKRNRPPLPRKVVGELVVTSVQTRTATAIVTRVAQEVHTGDYVEVQ